MSILPFILMLNIRVAKIRNITLRLEFKINSFFIPIIPCLFSLKSYGHFDYLYDNLSNYSLSIFVVRRLSDGDFQFNFLLCFSFCKELKRAYIYISYNIVLSA